MLCNISQECEDDSDMGREGGLLGASELRSMHVV